MAQRGSNAKMSRRKQTEPPRPVIRFRSRIVFVLVMAVGVVWVWFTNGRQGPQTEYRSLERIAEDPMSQGFRILEPPDLPGPYRWLDTKVLFAGSQGRVTAGGTTRTYTLPDDDENREYLAVSLTTRDDKPTYAILYRDRPDPEQQEQEKKKLRESLENKGLLPK